LDSSSPTLSASNSTISLTSCASNVTTSANSFSLAHSYDARQGLNMRSLCSSSESLSSIQSTKSQPAMNFRGSSNQPLVGLPHHSHLNTIPEYQSSLYISEDTTSEVDARQRNLADSSVTRSHSKPTSVVIMQRQSAEAWSKGKLLSHLDNFQDLPGQNTTTKPSRNAVPEGGSVQRVYGRSTPAAVASDWNRPQSRNTVQRVSGRSTPACVANDCSLQQSRNGGSQCQAASHTVTASATRPPWR
jgi:hypothetical protein